MNKTKGELGKKGVPNLQHGKRGGRRYKRHMSSLVRNSVPADNSCLFTSVAKLCEMPSADNIALKVAGRKLREACATAAAADPDPTMKALLLGHDSVEAYGRWIRLDHNWGGEPEVLMLADHFGVEIVVCSCESLSFLRYAAEGASTKGTCYLLYTGQHYDPLCGADGTMIFPTTHDSAAIEASALAIAKEHNEAAARRAQEKRVNRLKCNGCGALCDDAAAFQEHCSVVEHDDDFAYDCEQVEVVISAGEALPEGSVDLNAPDVHAFYNALSAESISLSMRCTAAPFMFPASGEGSVRYATLEECWRALEASGETLERRREALGEAIGLQYRTGAAATSGLRAHLLETSPKTIICVDLDPWLGMQASGGISAGQNGMGKALMRTRDELLREQAT